MNIAHKKEVIQELLNKEHAWDIYAQDIRQALNHMEKGGVDQQENFRLMNVKLDLFFRDVDLMHKQLKEKCLPDPKNIVEGEEDLLRVLLANIALMKGSLEHMKDDLSDFQVSDSPAHSYSDEERHYNSLVLSWVKVLAQAQSLMKTYSILTE